MSATLKIDVSGLKRLAASLNDPALKSQIMQVPQRKAVAALVGQAIADNFSQEGPGWPGLKAETIRRSLSKKMQKSIADMTDKELLSHERKARIVGSDTVPHRSILRRTGLLMRTASTPNYQGSAKSGKKVVSGTNIWKTEGTKLIFGTNLVYAAIHNYGMPSKGIPQREFMTLRKEWMDKLKEYVIGETFKIIWSAAKGAA